MEKKMKKFLSKTWGETILAILLVANFGGYLIGQQADVQNTQLNDLLDEITPAMGKGNVQRALDVIGDEVTAQDEMGNNILMALIASQSFLGAARSELMRGLISKGTDPVQVNDQGKTPLVIAAEKNDLDAVKVLLENGNVRTKIDSTDKEGNSAHMYAARQGNREMMKLLVDSGAGAKIDIALGELLDDIAPAMAKENVERALDIIGDNIKALDAAGNNILMLLINSQKFLGAGRTELIKGLINRGLDINIANAQGKTPLIIAAEKGDLNAIQLLLSAGANPAGIDYADSNGKTALFKAVQSNSATMVQQLLANGASATIAETKGDKMTSLIAAVRLGWAEGVKLLLASGAANVALEAKDAHGMTALAIAVEQANPELEQILLSAGANPAGIDYADSNGKTALFRAVQSKSAAGVQQLLAKRASATIAETKGDKMTPLISAVRQGWVEGVKLLLASGAANVALEAKDAHGMTALNYATEQENPEIMLLLLNAGAHNPTGLDTADSNGKTALFKAVQSKAAAMVQQLLAQGANATIAETKGDKMTPLMAAINQEWVEGVKLLLASGAANLALEAKDAHGMTALNYATQQENPEIMQLLLSAGASHSGLIATDKDGKTVLYNAVEQKSLPAVERILSLYGTSTALAWTRTGSERKTPLMRAVEIGWLEGVQAFLKNDQALNNGLNAQDARGWTALHYAAQNPIYPDIINALVASGADTTIKTKDGRDAWYYLSNSFWFSPKYDISGKKHSDGRKCMETKPCSLGAGKSGICCSKIE
jgi:ankyrin repeat protein